MERSNLSGLQSTNHRMQHPTIMKHYKVLFIPVMWVHQLFVRETERGRKSLDANIYHQNPPPKAYLWCNAWSLHFVQQVSYIVQSRDVGTMRIYSLDTGVSVWEGFDE